MPRPRLAESGTIRARMLDLSMNLIGRWVIQQNVVNDMAGELSGAVRSIKINDHKIKYFDIGSGHPVLLLHGLGSSSFSWLPTLVLGLGKDRRLIAMDQIGHGRSERPSIGYRITDFVRYLEAFIKELNLDKVDLVGNSLGGWIAARLAVERPDLVRRLALVCSGGLQPSPSVRAHLERINFAPKTYAQTRAILSLCFYDKERYVTPRSIAISYMLRRLEANHSTVENILNSIMDPNEWLDDKMEKVESPTLVLWGRQDGLLPVEFADQFAKGIPNAHLEIFEECGHVPQIERAKDFITVLSRFLD